MTAAHLARALGDTQGGEAQYEPLVSEVARTVRSQFAATVGNLGVVVPVVVLMDLGLRLFLGRGLLDAAYAEKVIALHHPLKSALLPGAALTGANDRSSNSAS